MILDREIVVGIVRRRGKDRDRTFGSIVLYIFKDVIAGVNSPMLVVCRRGTLAPSEPFWQFLRYVSVIQVRCMVYAKGSSAERPQHILSCSIVVKSTWTSYGPEGNELVPESQYSGLKKGFE